MVGDRHPNAVKFGMKIAVCNSLVWRIKCALKSCPVGRF